MTDPVDLAGLADILAEDAEMPYAQYMVRIPDRPGLYHLTVTPPGRESPQVVVERVSAERDVLLEHLKVNETLVASTNGAISALLDAADLVRANSDARDVEVDQRLHELDEILQALKTQQKIDTETVTTAVDFLRERYEVALKDLHDRLSSNLAANVDQLRGEQETGIKDLTRQLTKVTAEGLRETREGTTAQIVDLQNQLRAQADAHTKQMGELPASYIKALTKQAASADEAMQALVATFVDRLTTREDEHSQALAALTKGLEGKAGTKALENVTKKLTQLQTESSEHHAHITHLGALVEELRSSTLVDLIQERNARTEAERQLAELRDQVEHWLPVVESAMRAERYLAGVEEHGSRLTVAELVDLVASVRQLDPGAPST